MKFSYAVSLSARPSNLVHLDILRQHSKLILYRNINCRIFASVLTFHHNLVLTFLHFDTLAEKRLSQLISCLPRYSPAMHPEPVPDRAKRSDTSHLQSQLLCNIAWFHPKIHYPARNRNEPIQKNHLSEEACPTLAELPPTQPAFYWGHGIFQAFSQSIAGHHDMSIF